MAPENLTVKLQLTSEDLLKAIETLSKENKKTMASISANTDIQEEFSLSELDYDELLETYGDDPVLMTILNRMRDFFSTPDPEWFKFKEWPPGSSGVDPGVVKWDTDTTLDTTSTVSDTFTVKYDVSGSTTLDLYDSGAKYSINAE